MIELKTPEEIQIWTQAAIAYGAALVRAKAAPQADHVSFYSGKGTGQSAANFADTIIKEFRIRTMRLSNEPDVQLRPM